MESKRQEKCSKFCWSRSLFFLNLKISMGVSFLYCLQYIFQLV